MSYEPQLAPPARTNVFTEDLYKVRVTFGSAAVASVRAMGCTFARNSAGNYTLTLPKAYNEITDFSYGFLDASGAILFATVRSSTVTTDGKLVIEVVTETGTATDPTSGDVLYLTVGASADVVNNSFTT